MHVVVTGKVVDAAMMDALLRGEDEIVLGDRAYTPNNRTLEAEREPDEPLWAFPLKRKAGAELSEEQVLQNRMLAPMRTWSSIRFGFSKGSSDTPRSIIVLFLRKGSRWTCGSLEVLSITCWGGGRRLGGESAGHSGNLAAMGGKVRCWGDPCEQAD